MTQKQDAGIHNVVSAENISVIIGNKKTLEVPLFHIQPNEVLVIIGPNGSGKTTLVLCLSLLMKPTTGTISYQGEIIKDPKQILQIRRRLAVVFQESLLLNDSVWHNVTIGLHLRGVKKAEAGVRAQRWLERFGVSHLAKRQARTLSGGEAKRVSLARAFALEPDLLFLDEPFEGLDSPTRQSMTSDFDSVLRETKTTTVMVTHDRNEALMLAHRVAVLIGGRLRQIGTPDEVFNYPVDEEVATFVEAGNIWHGKVISRNEGLATIEIGGKQIEAVSEFGAGTNATICLKFEDVTLVGENLTTSTSARNMLIGKITRIVNLGAQVRVTLNVGFLLTAIITRRSYEGMDLKEGQVLTATFKASAIHLIKQG